MKILMIIALCFFCYWLGSRSNQIQVIVREVPLQSCEDIEEALERIDRKANWAVNAVANNLPYWDGYDSKKKGK